MDYDLPPPYADSLITDVAISYAGFVNLHEASGYFKASLDYYQVLSGQYFALSYKVYCSILNSVEITIPCRYADQAHIWSMTAMAIIFHVASGIPWDLDYFPYPFDATITILQYFLMSQQARLYITAYIQHNSRRLHNLSTSYGTLIRDYGHTHDLSDYFFRQMITIIEIQPFDVSSYLLHHPSHSSLIQRAFYKRLRNAIRSASHSTSLPHFLCMRCGKFVTCTPRYGSKYLFDNGWILFCCEAFFHRNCSNPYPLRDHCPYCYFEFRNEFFPIRLEIQNDYTFAALQRHLRIYGRPG